MDWIVALVSGIDEFLKSRDDTTIDRLNRIYTVAFVSAFIPLISAQQYIIGDRIVCWTPSEFSSSQNNYAANICWLGQTNYFVPENTTRLEHPSVPRAYPFLLYPWLPLILISIASSFLLPYALIWHGLSSRNDLNLKRLFTIIEREKLATAMDFVLSQRYLKKNNNGVYLISAYLLMKLFYILLVIAQILFVHKIIFGDYHRIDLKEIRENFSLKYHIWSSGHLPIEIMCDFMIRMLGNNNNWYTIQCLLPFNIFATRIFTFLIIWFYILFVLNVLDLFYNWLWRKLWSSINRSEYIYRFLDLYIMHSNDDMDFIHDLENLTLRDDFIGHYLMIDGYLLMKLLHGKASDVTMSRLTARLFQKYLKHRSQRMPRIINEPDGVTI